MYTIDQLCRYEYFRKALEKNGLSVLLDPLTGVVARPHILGFAQSLIAAGVPFSFAMLDLDNFKYINDTYGHHVGDVVLQNVGADLAAYLDGYGVVGRFGGDEMLIVNLRHISYDEKKQFLAGMYADARVLRRNIALEDCHPFITGTTGCASFPEDAGDYDSLFELIDKTLYRGKTKGRNCHIIYVSEKHQDIEIRQIARHGVYTTMHNLIRQYELVPGLMNKLRSVMPMLMEELRITDLYYVGPRGRLRAVRRPEVDEDAGDIALLMNDDLYSANSLEFIAGKCPRFNAALKKYEVETVLVARIGMDMANYGYLICAEPRSRRIWQEDECAIMYFLAKLLAASIRIEGEDIEA